MRYDNEEGRMGQDRVRVAQEGKTAREKEYKRLTRGHERSTTLVTNPISPQQKIDGPH